MTGLVDSLMENFYIPPIILNKRIPADKSKPAVHVCVDGKQRLSSVRAFVKGMIPCHDFRGEKWSVLLLRMEERFANTSRWFCDTPGSRRKKVLPEETQKTFLRKEFVSFEFKELLPDQEEDLFARVQMGVQLSLAEKMRASTGPWQELARLFVDDFPDIYSLMKDRARAKDFQLTLSCFSQIVEVMHPTASDGIPILRTNYNALPKLLSNKAAVDDALKSHLASVWNIFKELIDMDPDTFTNASKWLRGVQTFAPVEMVAVAVLISMYSDTRNKRLLLGDIRALREAIRENFNDIRMNTKEWSFIWKYIEELEAIRVKHPRPLFASTTHAAEMQPSQLGAQLAHPDASKSNRPIFEYTASTYNVFDIAIDQWQSVAYSRQERCNLENRLWSIFLENCGGAMGWRNSICIPNARPGIYVVFQETSYDGAIDLTSDSEQEQERQNLLLTFKAKAIADRKKQLQQNAASSPSRPESS
ncbi:hypothetical protein SNOG_07592 [Parastagonospora nodorum SN15]|uniref:DUF262 domain-containing protein n=1 Tax=Phaeosphaeria nodorum (strain SN15 / ATCC MYA-4574 / FGSC 10173) TaxID=321614 RepID=Q0UKX2_PHANO|nr:hypothetical protein SNOG_07592 [Parastagonospora nodorum SN15]EAT85058.2 hypothetical protein SNOG_07592 [Parastagonospora nodorum SN15]